MILMFGTFPPPVHGMAVMNQAVFEALNELHVPIRRWDTAPASLKRDLLSRLSRLPGIVRAWVGLIGHARRAKAIYLSMSAGWGQPLDWPLLIIGRLFGLRILIHHHSFAYIDRRSALSAASFALAGHTAIHIVLCTRMQSQLVDRYRVGETIILSNAAFMPPRFEPEKKLERHKLQTVGYLSNISAEKGGWEILYLASRLRRQGLPFRVIVGGPCQDVYLADGLQRAQARGELEWWGAIYDEMKQRFWQEVDVFIFPTTYPHEAEPLVIIEALSVKTPVISYERGCIRGQLGGIGRTIPQDADFASESLATLTEWAGDAQVYHEQVQRTKRWYREQHERGREQLMELVNRIERW